MASVADVFVLLRFIYKAFVMQMEFGLDDWFVLATVVAGIPSVVIIGQGLVPNGLGRDIWTLTATQITNVVRNFYMMAWLYFLQTALLKLTIICFYMRIFPSQDVRRLLWGTFIFVTLWGLAFVLTAIFQCWPISYFWHRWDGLHQGTCIEINSFSWSNAAMNIAIDCWILAIPIWQLRKLHLHWKKKIPVGIMFSLGFLYVLSHYSKQAQLIFASVTIVSILRLRSLVNFGTRDNVTWEFYDVALWSTIEVCVGIITACLPTVRIFLVKIFPILSGSSYASRGAYYNHSSNPRSGIMHPARNEVRIASKGRPESVSDGGSPPGIQFQKSYAVQYSDNDESSLVPGTEIELSSPPKTWQRNPPTN